MIQFKLPSLGADMDQGKLLEWQIAPGDTVKKGQVIAIVDTAKAAIDLECWHDGIVEQLLVEPGTTMPVGTPMALLRSADESAQQVDRQPAKAGDAARPETAAPKAAAPPPTPAQAEATAASTKDTPPKKTPKPPAAVKEAAAAPAPGRGEQPPATAARKPVSPAARKMAQELGVDVEALTGSGPQGSVTLADVEGAAKAPEKKRAAAPAKRATPEAAAKAPPREKAAPPTAAAPPEAAAAPPSRANEMRRIIAAAMARAKREIPHYYLAEDIPLAHATSWLATQNAGRSVAERLLLAPLLLKAMALALRRYPELNGTFRDGAFEAGSGIHIGVAISLRAGGLLNPALHDVDRKDIAQLNRELLDLIQRTRAGKLRSSELSDGTITVTSLGDQGVAAVFGIIYPPQVALVGFGRVTERPWAVDGALRAAPVVTASLAADHRVSDGHRGSLFLAAVRGLLQTPEELDQVNDEGPM